MAQAHKKPTQDHGQGHVKGQGHGHEQGQGLGKGHGQRPKRFQNIMKEIVSGMKKKEKESYHLIIIDIFGNHTLKGTFFKLYVF